MKSPLPPAVALRAGLDTSWMFGLAERLLSSIREKSLLMVLISRSLYCQLIAARSLTNTGMSFHSPFTRALATVIQVGWYR